MSLPYWLYQMCATANIAADSPSAWERFPQARFGLNCAQFSIRARHLDPRRFGRRSARRQRSGRGVSPALAGHRVVVSTTTDTGQKLARKRFGADNVFYFPMDFGFAIRPYLQALRPELVVIAETEFWPNFLRLAHERRAHRGRQRAHLRPLLAGYRRFRWALRRMLAHVDFFLAQTEQDRSG